jgi:hypothetical protein
MFFYDRDTGAAMSSRLDASGNFIDLKDFPAQSFADWTHILTIATADLFFYNRRTGGALTGTLDSTGNYRDLKKFPPRIIRGLDPHRERRHNRSVLLQQRDWRRSSWHARPNGRDLL